jgi:hypothetical protein
MSCTTILIIVLPTELNMLQASDKVLFIGQSFAQPNVELKRFAPSLNTV